MPREVQDHYFREAKRAGFRSRAAYKLIEIDDRRSVLRRGNAVLDCGAAPGSWLQVASERVGPNGVIVGIDLKEIRPLPQLANVHRVIGDLREVDAAQLTALVADRAKHPDACRFDVLLSDMAPNTTGDRNIDHHQSIRLCHLVLDRCVDLLQPDGNLVMKVFEGEAYRELLARTDSMFAQAKGFRPKASRGESTEIYLIAQGFFVDSNREAKEMDAGRMTIAPPPPSPQPGWGAS